MSRQPNMPEAPVAPRRAEAPEAPGALAAQAAPSCATTHDAPSAQGAPADAARFVRHAADSRADAHARFTLSRAFACAWEGIAYAFTSQRNLKIHSAFAALAVALGFALGISEAGWLAVVVCIALVMALEVVNTAVESVVDLVSPEWNELAKRAKDCAAGAVYLAAAASLVVAAIVFLPRLGALIF
ncbi:MULTISPECIES: diacylglycerol kinase family protein [unclassified Adlercreutzia]|uniref:diacylglycerol kinase family protein n=1 Tax=unclassified Adlercreutzia TaxID=2636013 RepID=UPI001F14D382|nr:MULTISPECIES: diacylglycerol kinase family protein [unclassified Adlercreutzia]